MLLFEPRYSAPTVTAPVAPPPPNAYAVAPLGAPAKRIGQSAHATNHKMKGDA